MCIRECVCVYIYELYGVRVVCVCLVDTRVFIARVLERERGVNRRAVGLSVLSGSR